MHTVFQHWERTNCCFVSSCDGFPPADSQRQQQLSWEAHHAVVPPADRQCLSNRRHSCAHAAGDGARQDEKGLYQLSHWYKITFILMWMSCGKLNRNNIFVFSFPSGEELTTLNHLVCQSLLLWPLVCLKLPWAVKYDFFPSLQSYYLSTDVDLQEQVIRLRKLHHLLETVLTCSTFLGLPYDCLFLFTQ